MQHQDWKPVVLKKDTYEKPKSAAGLAKAIKAGDIETIKRCKPLLFLYFFLF